MNEERKRKLENLKLLAKYTTIALFYATYATSKAAITFVTPGFKGQYGRNKMKIFATDFAYGATSFGDKEYQKQLLDILNEKEVEYFKIDLINNCRSYSKEQKKALRQPHLIKIEELNEQQKQLKKTRK